MDAPEKHSGLPVGARVFQAFGGNVKKAPPSQGGTLYAACRSRSPFGMRQSRPLWFIWLHHQPGLCGGDQSLLR